MLPPAAGLGSPWPYAQQNLENLMKWNPDKYFQFGDYRNRPFFDLTARIHADRPARVVDLGGGP